MGQILSDNLSQIYKNLGDEIKNLKVNNVAYHKINRKAFKQINYILKRD